MTNSSTKEKKYKTTDGKHHVFFVVWDLKKQINFDILCERNAYILYSWAPKCEFDIFRMNMTNSYWIRISARISLLLRLVIHFLCGFLQDFFLSIFWIFCEDFGWILSKVNKFSAFKTLRIHIVNSNTSRAAARLFLWRVMLWI